MQWLVGITFFSLSSFIWAGCSPVNLYADKANPLNKIPIYDQDGDGSCYAYTSAQLIDYYNLKKNPNHELSSALWIAFAHKYRNSKLNHGLANFIKNPRRVVGISKPNELGFSDINVALKDIRETGICDVNVLRESIKNFRLTNKLNDDEFLYLFNLYHQQLKSLKHKDDFIDSADVKRIFDIALNDLIEQRDSDILDEKEKWNEISELNSLRMRPRLVCGPELPSEDAEILFTQLTNVFSLDKKNKQLEIVRKYIVNKCYEQKNAIKKIQVPKFHHIGEIWASNEKILEAIDDSLDKKNAPAGVGHCSTFYENPQQTPSINFTPEGVIPSPRVLRLTKDLNVQKCSPHYALITGRREKDSKCQYMIRNSYGAHFWNKYLDCLCQKDGKQFDCSYKTHGDQDLKVLGCWVNGENLSKSTFSVTYFDK